MERSHHDDDYLFHDFSTGETNEPLPDIFQSIFSQAENPTSDYGFNDYDTEPYVGSDDFEDINPFVREDEYPEPDYDDAAPGYGGQDGDNIYNDSGEFRTYDGNHEYRSFDASLPEASPEGWYHYSDEDRELDSYNGEYDEEYPQRPAGLRHQKLWVFAHAVLAILTVFSLVYMIALYSNIGFVKRLRTMYIQTAMETLNHKWMATAIIPGDIIDEVMLQKYQSGQQQQGVTTDWGTVVVNPLPSFAAETTEAPAPTEVHVSAVEETPAPVNTDEETFFGLFHELDTDSMHSYLDQHPEALDEGWANIDINESGLDDEGTSIRTIHGDQVLAVNAKEGILLVRVGFQPNTRGILAICKNTGQLSLCPASTLGTIGQTAGRICDANNGILAINGSAFMDEAGGGNGGQLSGLMVCSGEAQGIPLGGVCKRLELRDDNRMYIVDSYDAVGEGTRDASEFEPAVIVDGEVVLGTGWDGVNPRAVLGQTDRLETIMVIAEGRYTDSPGCSVEEIAVTMQKYGCVQALNLDGGTSAIMYYKGEYVTRCSNPDLPGGRTLPSAWVYRYKS